MWAQLFPDRWWTFMNFGYDDLDAPAAAPSLTATERHWSSAVRLYDKVARTVALRGKDVLEVGSGRGGGAAYVARRFSPRSYAALDATRSNVLFSESVHRRRNLRFLHGVAEALPFAAKSVDAVINIQVCNYYDLHEFATEVRRVLRTSGHLITAFWDEPRNALEVRDAIGREGFRLVHQEDISSGVRTALTRFWNGDCEKLLRANRTVLRKKVYMEMLRFFFSSPGLMDRTSSYVIFVHERR
jgi:SAM-dependent methyltransferase